MFTRYVVSLALLLSIIGIGEAAQNCPAGTVPVLERIDTVVVQVGNTIAIERPPHWDGCVPAR